MKRIISPDEFRRDTLVLAQRVFEAGFHPTYVIGIARGGAGIAVQVHEYFLYRGFNPAIDFVFTHSYDPDGNRGQVNVRNIGGALGATTPEDHILFVDDVYDTGKSMAAIFHEASRILERNIRKQAMVATVYWKKKEGQRGNPDFYKERTEDEWLVFPHDLTVLDQLTDQERQQHLGFELEKILT